MKRAILVISAFLLSGCATQPLPQMPQYETSEGRDCAMECQRSYLDCIDSWRNSEICLGLGPIPADRVNDCRQILDECYQLCTAEEKVKS